MLGYFADPSRLERKVRAYRQLLPADGPLDVLQRPMPPDSLNGDELAAKVSVLRHGIRDIAFCHYGLMRLEALDWIAHALERV